MKNNHFERSFRTAPDSDQRRSRIKLRRRRINSFPIPTCPVLISEWEHRVLDRPAKRTTFKLCVLEISYHHRCEKVCKTKRTVTETPRPLVGSRFKQTLRTRPAMLSGGAVWFFCCRITLMTVLWRCSSISASSWSHSLFFTSTFISSRVSSCNCCMLRNEKWWLGRNTRRI